MGKKIYYDDDARKRVLGGAEILYNAVKTTMGPKGRNVVIAKNYGPPVVTHDGVTVAKAIELTETEETLGYKVGADLIRNAANKMEDVTGDGTTTVTVLTYHILQEANKLIAAGHSPMELRTGLEAASKDALSSLKSLSEDIKEDSPKVAQIATISAGDQAIGKLIADVMKQVGREGVVTVEEGQGLELESEVVKGFTFDRGFVSPYFVTDQTRMEAILEKPLILIADMKIRTMQNELLPIIEKIAQTGAKDLVIIAEDVEGEALGTLVLNKLKGVFNTIAVKAPSFGDQRKEILEDLAILTGATVITEDQGHTLANAELDMLGQAHRVLVTQNETTVIEGKGLVQEVESRIKQINKQSQNAKSEFDKERYNNRSAALGGKVAVIRVGGATETEIEEKKFRVDDAVHAVKAALAEGILAGGGRTLQVLANSMANNSDPGYNLLCNSLLVPFKILLENSGLEPARFYNELHEPKFGVDVRNGHIVNLKEVGIVDPTRVTKEAIQNAVSIAGTAITMGALVVEEPVENETTQIPPQMGMRP